VGDLGFHLLDSSLPLTPAPAQITLPLGALENCVGRYQRDATDYFEIALLRNHLTLEYSGDPAQTFTLFPSSAQSFFLTVVSASGLFQTNSQGAITAMVWNQGGQAYSYPKVAQPPRLAIQRQSGKTQLTFSGDSGVNYVVEASGDLNNWSPISTNTIWDLPIIDQPAEPLAQRFYRLRHN
jgi:hypothetical protein